MSRLVGVMNLIVSLAISAEAQQPGQRVYSVCEVLEDLPRLHGEIVILRAMFVTDAGEWLKDQDCKKEFKVGDCGFDPMLAVDWPENRSALHNLRMLNLLPKEGLFPTDVPGGDLIEQALSTPPTEGVKRIPVVVEGLLATRLPLTKLVHPSTPKQPAGFGHLGAAPAMFVVKRVIEVGGVKPAARK